MIFFIHNSHKFLPFVVVFCCQVFHSFFIIHPCCRLVVNLVSKKHRKKNNLPMAFFIFRSWFTCSCPFVIHHAFRSFIIPVVDLQLTQLVKYTQKRRKKTTYLLHFHFSFTVHVFLPFCHCFLSSITRFIPFSSFIIPFVDLQLILRVKDCSSQIN